MSTSPVTPAEPRTFTREELKKLAEEQFAAEQAPPPVDTNTKVETPEDDGEPTRTIYQAKIDIGDGAGVQIFEADTEAELVQKLVKAQENATRKIRELAVKAAPQQPESPKSKEYTSDEEFMLSQELFATPSKAFQKLFQDVVGVPISEFRTQLDAVRAFQKEQATAAASTEFVSKHSDYLANDTNGKRMVSYVNSFFGGNVTVENLEKAYAELNSSGLLEQAQPTTEDTEDEPTTKPTLSRIVKPAGEETVEVVQRQRVASGLSLKRRATVPRTPQVLTEEEFRQLPRDKQRELALQGLKESQGA